MTDHLGIAGRQVLVAGSTGRIGTVLARAFAAHGANLILHTFTREATAHKLADELFSEHGVQALTVKGNILDAEEMAALRGDLEAKVGALDVVVNCITGFDGKSAGAQDLDAVAFRHVIDVDLVGCFLLARACIPLLARAKQPTLILFSSLAGMRGRPGAVHLCAAKAGIIGLTRSLAMDLYSSDIRVNAIAPGPVGEVDGGAVQGPTGQVAMSSPSQVSNIALFLASGLSTSLNGQVLSVNGGRV
jgi:3-oxoacyl-[acyl-carrier protein] reductase